MKVKNVYEWELMQKNRTPYILKKYILFIVAMSCYQRSLAEVPSPRNPIDAELVGDQVSQVFTVPGITWYDCAKELDPMHKEHGCAKAIGWLSKNKKRMKIQIVGPKISANTYDPVAVALADEGQPAEPYMEEYYPVKFEYERNEIEMEGDKFRYVKLKKEEAKTKGKRGKPKTPSPAPIEDEIWIDKFGRAYKKQDGKFTFYKLSKDLDLNGFTPAMVKNPNYSADGRIGYVRASSIRCKPTDKNDCSEFNQNYDPDQKALIERLSSDEAPAEFVADCKIHLAGNPNKMKNPNYRKCMQEHADNLLDKIQPQVNEIYKRIVKHLSYCNDLTKCLNKLKNKDSAKPKSIPIPCDSCLSKEFKGFTPFSVVVDRRTSETLQITPEVLQRIDRMARTGFGEMASCNKYGTQFMGGLMRVAINRAKDENFDKCLWQGREAQEKKDRLSAAICSPSQFNVWMTGGTNSNYSYNPSLKNALCPLSKLSPEETEHDSIEDMFRDMTIRPDSKKQLNAFPAMVSWRLTLKNAIEAVVFEKEFLSRTADMQNLFFYTSGRSRFGKYSPVEATISGRPLSKFACFNLWEKKDGLTCQKRPARNNGKDREASARK